MWPLTRSYGWWLPHTASSPLLVKISLWFQHWLQPWNGFPTAKAPPWAWWWEALEAGRWSSTRSRQPSSISKITRYIRCISLLEDAVLENEKLVYIRKFLYIESRRYVVNWPLKLFKDDTKVSFYTGCPNKFRKLILNVKFWYFTFSFKNFETL